jgi:hypothetical protein
MVMSDSTLMGMQPLSLWAGAALLAVLLILFVVAVRRSGSFGSIAALFAVPSLVVIAWSAWNFTEHSILRQRGMEREALNARAWQLTAAAIAPGSPLACLDGVMESAAEGACEATVFLKPETVAAATAFVEAKLRLLADSLSFAHRSDSTYYGSLTQLRNGVEADRYGFVAYVLMTRDGCTADSCSLFPWLLRDASAVKANMGARTFERNIARYAVNWPASKSSPVAAASPESLPSGTFSPMPMTRGIDFPTAASIPPVSIMTDQAGASASSSGQTSPQNNAASAAQTRRPAANAGGGARPAPSAAPAAARPQ